MSNQDEEPKEPGLPTYQFFSADLYHNYFTDSANNVAPQAVTDSFLSGADLSTSIPSISFPSTSLPSLIAPSSVMPSTYTQSTDAPGSTASSLTNPEPVPYSLTDDEPEPTFEERAATAPIPVAEPSQTEEKWNRYVEPSTVPDVFSADFNFNRSLLKIFWRIDVDHNNRVSKKELALALQENWFDGDEKVLAKLLYESYEDISPETIFCDAGLSINNILNFGPFGEMAAEQLETEIPDRVPPPRGNDSLKQKLRKSSQSLRKLFK